MKKHTLTAFILFIINYSYTQQSDFLIQETNINHDGVSLGIHLADDYILYSQQEKGKRGLVSNKLYSAKLIDSITFDVDNTTELKQVNITFNNGSPSVFEDELYYTSNSGLDDEYFENQETDFTVNKSGENTLQIFISKRDEKGDWQFPTYASFSNIEHNFTTPFITKDGSKLYFASDIPGGFGGYDIYVSLRQDDNSWGAPLNLGPNVNSSQNDVYPSYYEGVLYFSSKENETAKMNFFYTQKENELWKKRKEYAVLNSSSDDFGLRFVTAKTGYFSSNRDGDDFDKTFYFNVKNYKEEKEVVVETPIKKEDTLLAEIVKETKKVVVDVAKTKLISSKAVYFDLNSFRVKSQGRFELDKLVNELAKHTNYSVEILGYTDASGANDMNLELSKKRAKKVEEYIIGKGIASTKIVEVKGYGEKNLINDCLDYNKCGEEANAKNRRVEVKVLEIIK